MEISFIDDAENSNEFTRHHNDLAFQKVIGLSYSLCILYEKVKKDMEKNNIPIQEKQALIFENMEDEYKQVIPCFQETAQSSKAYFEGLKKGGEEFVNRQHKLKGCVVCLKNIDKPSKCSLCQSKYTHYCSKECQKKEWKNHKHFCNDLAKLRQIESEEKKAKKQSEDKSKDKCKAN